MQGECPWWCVFFRSDTVSILARAGWCVCVLGVGTGRDGIKGR